MACKKDGVETGEDSSVLAGRAELLSTHLHSLQEQCGHEGTSDEISKIAGELNLLSTTLWRLHEAIAGDQDHYTAAFKQDLAEITQELRLLFDEISECCEEMQRTDSHEYTMVGWFFRRGRVSKLHKHLEALKTTLVVMRTVLHHGKQYGVQNSPGRLAESSPHTMHEDRVILESVFAKNRHAIIDLHNLDNNSSHNHNSTSSSKEIDLKPGAHGRSLSLITGVDTPPCPDVLPEAKQPDPAGLGRRFSKRGVRLGVHMSILDLGAHDVPTSLRKKWIQESRHRLNKIPEDEDAQVVTLKEALEETSPAETSADIEAPASTIKRQNSHSLIQPPVGHTLRNVIRRLSVTSFGAQRKLTKPELSTPDFNTEFENGARL